MIGKKFKDILKKHRYYVTAERVRLFEELKDQKNPCSIADLISRTKDAIDDATVYRNVALFEKLGITNRIYTGREYGIELSDEYSSHHHHMTCTNCGTVISFKESGTLKAELQKLDRQNNFKSESHSLELKGLCSSCC